MPWQPICPYCNGPAKLIDSSIVYGTSYGWIWDCRPCDAYVGVHKDSREHAPLGTLANRELREWRKRAHRVFDPLWKSGRIKRREAYRIMREIMNLDEEDAHIAMFTVEQCKQLIQLLAKLPAPADAKEEA